MSEVQFVTTPTEKREFRSCRRRWWLTTQERLNRRNAIAWELEFGDVLHIALAAYYLSSRSLSVAIEEFGAAWNTKDERFAREYGGLYQMGIQEKWGEMREMGMDMLTYYDRFDHEHPLFSMDDVIDFDVERRHFVPILDPDTREPLPGEPMLSFQIDLAFHKPHGIVIMDHKGLASPHNSNALDVDDQLTAYMYGFWRLTGTAPVEAVYNVLRKDPPHAPQVLKSDKPGKRLSQRKDARVTHDTFLETAKLVDPEGLKQGAYAEYLDMLEGKGYDQFFVRETVRRSMEELESFERRLYNEYIDMVDATENEGARYPNPSQWNCQRCPVLDVCKGMERQEDLEYLISNGYDRRPPRFEIPKGA